MTRPYKYRVWNGREMVSPDYIDREGFAHWREDSVSCQSQKIMQSTGLKDANGKKIYEGDVLQNIYSKTLFNWLISFNDGAFILRNIGVDGYLMDEIRLTQSSCLERVVIGNTYANPELLES